MSDVKITRATEADDPRIALVGKAFNDVMDFIREREFKLAEETGSPTTPWTLRGLVMLAHRRIWREVVEPKLGSSDTERAEMSTAILTELAKYIDGTTLVKIPLPGNEPTETSNN